MPASLSGVFNVQCLTDAGAPAASYRLYTYAQGTTTHKTAYTDAAGLVAHTYTADGIGGQFIALNARGELPAPFFLASGPYDLALKTPAGATVWTRYAVGSADSVAAAMADIANAVSASNGAGQVGYNAALSYAPGTIGAAMRRSLSVLDYMDVAQITDYQARTAVADMVGALDLTAPIQTAINAAYAAGQSLYFPPGAAKVAGLEVPTTTASYEDRGDTWCMYGAGAPQPFVREPRAGTVLISSTDAPVFRYHQRRVMPTSGGNTQVRGIRFEQRNVTATSPVVLWDSMSEDADFSHNSIVQFGLGDGFKVTYQIKGNIERNFVMCGAYFTGGRSVAGVGFNIPSAADAGMLTVRKNTARSFFWGYVHGDGTNDSSGALFEQCESSDCVNGMWNKAGCTGATFSKTYTEGITGTCIKDEGTMTTIAGGMHYLGFTVGIDASATSNYGTLIEGNYLETAGPGCTLIEVGSGGPTKTVCGNHLLFSTSGGSVTNVIGIEIAGLNARLDITGNAFLPRGAWTGGAGTVKILNSSTGGLIGSLPLADGTDNEIPSLLRGAVTYQQNASALTQVNVNGSNVLALPPTNSVLISATSAALVTGLSQAADFVDGARPVSLRTTTANMTFQDSATLQLAGGVSFTGPGILELQVEVAGGVVYGYEKSRSVY